MTEIAHRKWQTQNGGCFLSCLIFEVDLDNVSLTCFKIRTDHIRRPCIRDGKQLLAVNFDVNDFFAHTSELNLLESVGTHLFLSLSGH